MRIFTPTQDWSNNISRLEFIEDSYAPKGIGKLLRITFDSGTYSTFSIPVEQVKWIEDFMNQTVAQPITYKIYDGESYRFQLSGILFRFAGTRISPMHGYWSDLMHDSLILKDYPLDKLASFYYGAGEYGTHIVFGSLKGHPYKTYDWIKVTTVMEDKGYCVVTIEPTKVPE